MSTLPNGLVTFGPSANCTLDLCPLEASLLRYQPNIPANAIFIAVLSISMAIHIVQGLQFRTWGFMSSMVAGCVLEIVGYIGCQIIKKGSKELIAASSINFVNPNISRFPASYFGWIFITSDIVSLILQAVGGALSCTGADKHAIEIGEHISLAGLIFQVVTLVCFCALFADYVIRAFKVCRHRLSKPVIYFLVFLFFSTLFILIRCIYRIAELYQGYFSAIFRDEGLFIGLESCMMCVAVLLLNAGHPGYVFSKKEDITYDVDKDGDFEQIDGSILLTDVEPTSGR
ncbi:phospholipid-translocating ATPase [Fusarium pseudoanthophilum]|uniref:Phospholipid-translocating ATPase n=1 Tax=Fusarium pseudoanthophilum TaxID=48495 RepID=A0A8H5PPB9_9HYPO|nr:phospholipid-translocating ATPase [Fusarium pseudoanthophilum]